MKDLAAHLKAELKEEKAAKDNAAAPAAAAVPEPAQKTARQRWLARGAAQSI